MADDCFDSSQSLGCAMSMARVGVGSIAGLAGCVALILAGNLAFLAETVRARAEAVARALHSAATPSVVFAVVQGEAVAGERPADPTAPDRTPLEPACR
jgi:hypothetical protein